MLEGGTVQHIECSWFLKIWPEPSGVGKAHHRQTMSQIAAFDFGFDLCPQGIMFIALRIDYRYHAGGVGGWFRRE